MSTTEEEALNRLRASNPEARNADMQRVAPNFAKRNRVRMIRRFAIGFAAIAVLSVPAFLSFVGQGGAGDEVQISSEVVDDVKGTTQKDGQKSSKKSNKKTKKVSFTGVPSLELGAAPTELVGADQNFRSVRDGFSFPNYSGKPTKDEIDATTMAALFGKEAVCADQNAALCVMLPGAQAVADQLNEAMASGRCEGMSVLAQRFYDGYESRPNGEASTVQIAKDSVAKQIGYWWATQVAPPVAANSVTYRAMTPVQITNEIINGLRSRAGFTLGLYSAAGGHSVTPIAVTRDGNNFNIYVYDNNYPSEIRKVIVESATETWTYRGAAISSGSTSSTWSGVGAGSMDLTSMASRQGPFKVSLGGTKGVKGLNYSVIVTQKGNTSDPVGLKITSRFGEVNSLDPKSVSTSKFPVKSFLGAGVGQGAIAYIPTTWAEEDGLDLEIVGGKKTGEYVVSVMRTGSAGVVVESSAKVEISIENSPSDTKLEIDLPNRNDSASVLLSNGNFAVDLELVKGQSVDVLTSIFDDDAFRGSRRIEESAPTFMVQSWNGQEVASGVISSKLQKGQAQVVSFAVNPDTGEISTSVQQVVGVNVDNGFINTVGSSNSANNLDTVNQKPTIGNIETNDPIQLPSRAVSGTTTTTTTATTVAPPDPPALAPTLAPETVVITLGAERLYGDLNSTIRDSDWAKNCVDSNSSGIGCAFLANVMNTSVISDWANMSLTLGQTANVGSYSSETDSGVLSAELKAIAGWPSNYSAKIIVRLKVLPRPLAVTADAKSKVFDSADPVLTYSTIGLKAGDSITGSLSRAVGEGVGTFAISQGNVTAGDNYTINFVPANLTITAKRLTVTADAKSKIYDSVDPVLTYSTVGLKAGDSITGVLSRDSGENVGTFAIGRGSVTAGDNYTINFVPANLTITAKPLTVTADAQTKVYDSVDPVLTYSTIGLKAGDSITGALSRAVGENVGTFAIGQGNVSAGDNYTISFTGADLTITVKTLRITADAQTKVYDSADPVLTYSQSGLKSGDSITGSLSRDTGENVGRFAIGLGNVTAGGNYRINFVSANLTITAKPLTVTAGAKTKIYGDNDPVLTYSTIGLKSGDSITGSLSRDSGENVGTFAIGQGNVTAGGNYSINFVPANLTITAKPLTVTADAQTKVYDSADPVLTYSQSGLKSGDSITGSLSRDTGENVGRFAIGLGNVTAGGNYRINFVSANLTITAKPLTVTAGAKTKIYGDNDPVLTYSTIGLKTGDSISGSLARVVGENVGTFAIGLGNVTAGDNYAISFTGANLTITAKTLTVTAESKTKIYGDIDPALTYSLDGLKSGDSLSGSLSRVAGENIGTFAILIGSLENTNYLITFNTANLTITTKSLTITANTQTKVFDSADPVLTYSTVGLVPGDSLSGSLSRVAGEDVGTFKIEQGTLSASSNYTISFTSADLTISAKPLTVSVSVTSPIVVGTTASASASYVSKGTLTWSAGPADICTISASGIVTALKEGECKVAASVAASGNYQAGFGATLVLIQVEKANCGGGNGVDPNTPGCTGGGNNEAGVTVAPKTTTTDPDANQIINVEQT